MERGNGDNVLEKLFQPSMNSVYLEMRFHICGTSEKNVKNPLNFFILKSNCGRIKSKVSKKLLFYLKFDRSYS
ncbi:rCG21386, isoform CRA_b, partial [Rattus norvegicus]